MTPGGYIKLARDIAIGVVLAFIAWRIYTDGQNAVKAKDFKALQQQVSEQAKMTTRWHTEATQANEQLAKDVHSINTAPVVVHDWVRAPTSCPKTVLSTAPGTSGSATSGEGGIQPVPGTADDGPRRDAILDAYKKQWETRLAGWRLEHSEWPSQ